MTFTLQHRQVLKGIPSASGIENINGTLYVIGDNSAWLYQLHSDYTVAHKRLLMEGIADSILPKASKPDFESITSMEVNGRKKLLIFGSGSVSPERDQMAHVSFDKDSQPKLYALTNLYDALRTSGQIDASTLNIEAAAVVGDDLYLFNRETNMLIVYSLQQLLDGTVDGGSFPEPSIYAITLPSLDGHQAKFSGAAAIDGAKQLIFTASVEDTPNTYDDGEVLGSYVGLIDVEALQNHYQPVCIPIMENDRQLPVKVESVEVLKALGPTHLELVLVTDSDGGDSELLLGVLEL